MANKFSFHQNQLAKEALELIEMVIVWWVSQTEEMMWLLKTEEV